MASTSDIYHRNYLTLTAPITTAADDIYKILFHCFSEIIRLDVSCETSARQRIHMKNQALFSSKDKSKKSKCRLLQFLVGALRVKRHNHYNDIIYKSVFVPLFLKILTM